MNFKNTKTSINAKVCSKICFDIFTFWNCALIAILYLDTSLKIVICVSDVCVHAGRNGALPPPDGVEDLCAAAYVRRVGTAGLTASCSLGVPAGRTHLGQGGRPAGTSGRRGLMKTSFREIWTVAWL